MPLLTRREFIHSTAAASAATVINPKLLLDIGHVADYEFHMLCDSHVLPHGEADRVTFTVNIAVGVSTSLSVPDLYKAFIMPWMWSSLSHLRIAVLHRKRPNAKWEAATATLLMFDAASFDLDILTNNLKQQAEDIWKHADPAAANDRPLRRMRDPADLGKSTTLSDTAPPPISDYTMHLACSLPSPLPQVWNLNFTADVPAALLQDAKQVLVFPYWETALPQPLDQLPLYSSTEFPDHVKPARATKRDGNAAPAVYEIPFVKPPSAQANATTGPKENVTAQIRVISGDEIARVRQSARLPDYPEYDFRNQVFLCATDQMPAPGRNFSVSLADRAAHTFDMPSILATALERWPDWMQDLHETSPDIFWFAFRYAETIIDLALFPGGGGRRRPDGSCLLGQVLREADLLDQKGSNIDARYLLAETRAYEAKFFLLGTTDLNLWRKDIRKLLPVESHSDEANENASAPHDDLKAANIERLVARQRARVNAAYQPENLVRLLLAVWKRANETTEYPNAGHGTLSWFDAETTVGSHDPYRIEFSPTDRNIWFISADQASSIELSQAATVVKTIYKSNFRITPGPAGTTLIDGDPKQPISGSNFNVTAKFADDMNVHPLFVWPQPLPVPPRIPKASDEFIDSLASILAPQLRTRDTLKNALLRANVTPYWKEIAKITTGGSRRDDLETMLKTQLLGFVATQLNKILPAARRLMTADATVLFPPTEQDKPKGSLDWVDGFLREQMDAIVREIVRQAAREILPDEVVLPNAMQPPTPVPHPIVVELEGTRPDDIGTSGIGDEDPHRVIAGSGLLVRRGPAPWRLANFASLSALPMDWLEQAKRESDERKKNGTVVPSPLHTLNGLRGSSMEYRGVSLVASMPQDSLLEIGTGPTGPFARTLWHSIAGWPEKPWTKSSRLEFGQTYELLPFFIRNGGALPPWLAATSHPAALRDFTEAQAAINALAANELRAAVRTYRYLRRVPVSPPRYIANTVPLVNTLPPATDALPSTASSLVPTASSAKDLAPLPGRLSPLAREITWQVITDTAPLVRYRAADGARGILNTGDSGWMVQTDYIGAVSGANFDVELISPVSTGSPADDAVLVLRVEQTISVNGGGVNVSVQLRSGQTVLARWIIMLAELQRYYSLRVIPNPLRLEYSVGSAAEQTAQKNPNPWTVVSLTGTPQPALLALKDAYLRVIARTGTPHLSPPVVWADDKPVAASEPSPNSIPLLVLPLATPQKLQSPTSEFSFRVGLPTTDRETFAAWGLATSVALATLYPRLDIDNNCLAGETPIDPAVNAAKIMVELVAIPASPGAAQTSVLVSRNVATGPTGNIHVTCRYQHGALSPEIEATGTELTVLVPPGNIFELRFYAYLPDISKFAPVFSRWLKTHPETPDGAAYLTDPLVIRLEGASLEMPSPADLWDATAPSLVGESVSVSFRPNLSRPGFASVGETSMRRQLWDWSGRAVDDIISELDNGWNAYREADQRWLDQGGLSSHRLTPGMDWEVQSFSDRFDFDVTQHRRHLRHLDTFRADGVEIFREPFGGDTRARYYRFGLSVRSRYAELFPSMLEQLEVGISRPGGQGLTGLRNSVPDVLATRVLFAKTTNEASDIWRRLLVPCRMSLHGAPQRGLSSDDAIELPAEQLPPVSVRFVTPMTEDVVKDDGVGRSPSHPHEATRLLVSAHEHWYQKAGLGETLVVETITVSVTRGRNPTISLPNQGPDIIRTDAPPNLDAGGTISPYPILGFSAGSPIGHSFDDPPEDGIKVNASFPIKVRISDPNRSYDWYFAQLQFRRRTRVWDTTSASLRYVQSPPSGRRWVQILPDTSIGVVPVLGTPLALVKRGENLAIARPKSPTVVLPIGPSEEHRPSKEHRHIERLVLLLQEIRETRSRGGEYIKLDWAKIDESGNLYAANPAGFVSGTVSNSTRAIVMDAIVRRERLVDSSASAAIAGGRVIDATSYLPAFNAQGLISTGLVSRLHVLAIEGLKGHLGQLTLYFGSRQVRIPAPNSNLFDLCVSRKNSADMSANAEDVTLHWFDREKPDAGWQEVPRGVRDVTLPMTDPTARPNIVLGIEFSADDLTQNFDAYCSLPFLGEAVVNGLFPSGDVFGSSAILPVHSDTDPRTSAAVESADRLQSMALSRLGQAVDALGRIDVIYAPIDKLLDKLP